MTMAISILYTVIVNWVLERPSKLLWTYKEVLQSGNIVRNFRGAVINHFDKYQASGFCTRKSHRLYHLGEDIRQYGNMRMLDGGLYESRHVVFREQ